ncbi:sugar ABC transporter substrate-binding protein [Modestobacter versicolor]|uniref:sugar ABC transporter substrate-binding protein n=1 Tax=Modestobacter versicolor TaxID=429133 RepID=UPI0034DE4173
MSTPPRHTAVVRGLTALACAGTLLLAAACSSADEADTAEAGTGGGSAAADVNADALAAVESDLAEPEPFSAPGPALEGVDQVAGKKVLYIPISLQIPAFQSVYAAVQEATGEVGMEVSSCDGKFNPAGVAACINQALAQDVDVVVLDQVPLGLAAQGVAQLQAAGISILVSGQEPAPGTAELAYLDTGGAEIITSMADWVTVDSGGKANVLVVAQADSPRQEAYISEGLIPRFEEVCPDCTTTVTTTTASQLSQLGTQVSAALLQDPDIDYVVSEFDANVSYILQGLQNAPTGEDVKVVSAIGDIASLERVASGQQAYDALGSNRWAGWAITDQVLRMLTGAEPLETSIGPARAFDSSNIDSVEVDQSSFDDESLWGGDTYTDVYRQVWGLS